MPKPRLRWNEQARRNGETISPYREEKVNDEEYSQRFDAI